MKDQPKIPHPLKAQLKDPKLETKICEAPNKYNLNQIDYITQATMLLDQDFDNSTHKSPQSKTYLKNDKIENGTHKVHPAASLNSNNATSLGLLG